MKSLNNSFKTILAVSVLLGFISSYQALASETVNVDFNKCSTFSAWRTPTNAW